MSMRYLSNGLAFVITTIEKERKEKKRKILQMQLFY